MPEANFIHYRTSDLYFSAYLCSNEIPMVSTERAEGSDSKKLTFVFRVQANQVDKLRASYFGGHGTVKALKFVERLRSLKSMCYN
jgi:hypothetical protein